MDPKEIEAIEKWKVDKAIELAERRGWERAIAAGADDLERLAQAWGDDSPLAKEKRETYLYAATRLRALTYESSEKA